MREPGLLARILTSLRDGTFAVKLLNRLSRIEYVPAHHVLLDRYVAQHYPQEEWKSLSRRAREVWVHFSPLFSDHEIRTLAYVGANVGQTALAMDEAFPGLELFLLEPVPHVFEALSANTSGHSNMHCLNVAAGSEDGWLHMCVDHFSPASSLLPYEPLALREFPFLGNQTPQKVRIRPLDDILRDCGAGEIDLLLMDAQGYEDEVLRGAGHTLSRCKAVVSELSLQPLYTGSSTFDSVYQALHREGFVLHYLINPLEGDSHLILQIDGVFVRLTSRQDR